MNLDNITQFERKLSRNFKDAVEKGECVRLFHGRGKLIEGFDFFNIDFYPPAIFITVFEDRPFQTILSSITKLCPELSIIVQKRYLRPVERELFGPAIEEDTICLENDLKFSVNLLNNQNPGLFLDMKNGKKWILENAKNKSVLNLFSYTCSVSVYALRAGATKVLNIDQKKTFLNIGRQNHRLNGLEEKAVFRNWDIKKSVNQIAKQGPFDIVFCDPPSNQGKSFYYKNDYPKIVSKARKLLNHGGLFVACINTPFERSDYLLELFKDSEDKWTHLETLYSSEDFEESDKENGVKICVFRLN